MLQCRHFLGFWQILHVGKAAAFSFSPWIISWKTKMHPHMHDHAWANRTSSKKFLRKTWMVPMASYPNIQLYTLRQLQNLSKVCSSNLPPEVCQGVENIMFHLWFFQRRKRMSKKDWHTETLNISKLIWKQNFSDNWNGKVWKLSRHRIFWIRATALFAMQSDTAISSAAACWTVNCLCLKNLTDLHWIICMSSWGIWLDINQEIITSNAAWCELACDSSPWRLQGQGSHWK